MTDQPRPDGLPAPTSAFEAASVDLLADLFEAYPTWGTAVGYHMVDARWPDASGSGRVARLEMLRRHAERLRGFGADELSAGEALDRDILLEEIERIVFAEDVLREEAWDPLSIVYLLGNGVFGLLSREFAPWPTRGASLLARIEAMPELIGQALAGLTGLADRPVALVHLDTALAQLGGVDELIDATVAEARRRADGGEAPQLVADLEAAAIEAKTALATLREALDGDVRARAAGEGRLGRELFAQKLRLTLGSETTPEALRDRAWADVHAIRAEMLRLAREAWPQWLPDEPLPEVEAGDTSGQTRIVRRVLDAIAGEHQSPDGLIGFCEAELERIEAFCRDNAIISLPDEPMTITWTPAFMRAYGGAFLDSPGPLDRGEKAHFWITPPDESKDPDDVASYLREDNDRMLRLLTIHEGVPGHYLQLAASNTCPSLARTVFSNGMFAEGWAVYVTQVMMDAGYGADDAGLLLIHWKFYLRAVMNSILDVEIHAGSMTEDEAIELMVELGFQEEHEAKAKWLRALITSTQLSTYYVGSVEMWDLEVEARRRAAIAAGAGIDAVPGQRIAGGLGDTPGFDQRAHLEAVIGHGTPAIKWCRRIVLGTEA